VPPSTGLAALRLTPLGACNVPSEPTYNVPVLGSFPVFDRQLDFTRQRAALVIRASERWSGGHLAAVGWKAADGTVARLLVEMSAERGYGSTYSTLENLPEAPQGAQSVPHRGFPTAIGYTEWRDGARTFAAMGYLGFITYEGLQEREVFTVPTAGTDDGPRLNPAHLYAQVAFDGLDETGARACRIIALHGMAGTQREDPFDPTWLIADPDVMILDATRQVPPTFLRNVAPGDRLLDPSDVGVLDVELPRLTKRAPSLDFRQGAGGNACD